MTVCQFDREQVALFAADDLPPAESAAVAAHLDGCEDCAWLVRQHQALRAALQDGLCTTPAPAALGRIPAAAQQPRWWRAAAVALVAVIVVACSAPLALRWLRVHVMTEEQTLEHYRQQLTAPSKGSVIVSAAEAEKALGRPLLQPGYLPEGYKLEPAIYRPEEGSLLFYRRGGNQANGLMISQMKLEKPINLAVPNDTTQRYVMVNGTQALLAEGVYMREPGQEPPAYRQLAFSLDDQVIMIFASERVVMYPPKGFQLPKAPLPSAEELIKIAESLR